MSDSPTGYSSRPETTLLIANLVLTFIGTAILSLKIRMKCCCGELAMKGKDNTATDSPPTPAPPPTKLRKIKGKKPPLEPEPASDDGSPSADVPPLTDHGRPSSVHIKSEKDGSITIECTPAQKKEETVIDVIDADERV